MKNLSAGRIFLVLGSPLFLVGCTTAQLSKYVGKTGTLSNRHSVVAIGVEQCKAMQNQCIGGHFNEWLTEEKEVRCSCNQ